jgi:lysophospholipase L1-like esterase
MRQRFLAPALVGLTLGLGITVVATEAALYSHNTLAAHPEWVTSKLLLAEPIMGADMQLVTRNLLGRNRLNLDAWHGFNEVLLDRVGTVGRVRFRFRLGDEAYLYAVFDRTAAGFSAVRLSRAAGFRSAWVRATPGGRFVDLQPLPELALSGGWHEAELRLGGAGARLALDGAPRAEWPTGASAGPQVIGFRGGSKPVAVDDVEVEDGRGRRIVTEGFANRRGAGGFAAAVAALLAALAGALAWLARRGAVGPRPALLLFLMLEIVLLAIAGSLYAFDFLVWSERYPRRDDWTRATLDETLTRPEAVRLDLVARLPFVAPTAARPARPRELESFLGLSPAGSWRLARNALVRRAGGEQGIEEIGDDETAIRGARDAAGGPSPLRVLVLGTSQAWGAGAWHPGERIAARLERELHEALPGREVVVLNASRRGSSSKELLERFRARLHAFEPHVVVVQLSNNDRPEGFGQNLAAIAAQARAGQTRVVFVLEANSPEAQDSLASRHAIMRETAAREQVGLADLHGHLGSASLRDSGILWWDRVHLTAWGQELAGRFLSQAVLEQVRPGPGD